MQHLTLCIYCSLPFWKGQTVTVYSCWLWAELLCLTVADEVVIVKRVHAGALSAIVDVCIVLWIVLRI